MPHDVSCAVMMPVTEDVASVNKKPEAAMLNDSGRKDATSAVSEDCGDLSVSDATLTDWKMDSGGGTEAKVDISSTPR